MKYMSYIPDLARIIPAIIVLAAYISVMLRIRLVQERHNVVAVIFRRNKIAQTLITLAFLALIPKPTPLFLRLVAVTAMPLGLMLNFLIIQQILETTVISEKKISLIISTICMTTVFFDVLRGGNDGSFIDINEKYTVNVPYFLYYLCFFLNLMIITFCSGILHIKALYQQYNDFIDLRIFCNAAAHFCGFFATLVITIDLILNKFISLVTHSASVIIFHTFVIIYAVLSGLGVSSNNVFQAISMPFAPWIRKYKERQKRKIEDLHRIMITISPIVQLPASRFQEKRMLVEISNARRLIWSNHNLPRSISPKEEVNLIVNLFQKNVAYKYAGPYRPPDKPEHPQTYFARLADALYAKERNMSNTTIPQIDGIPLLGNVLDFRSKRLDLLLRTSGICGDIGAFFLGKRPVVVINESQLIQEVLVEQAYYFSKPSNVRRLLLPIIGGGSFLLEGDEHRSRRKLMASFFQPRQVAKYTEKMLLAIERWQEQIYNKPIIDVNDEMFRLTLSVAGETIFSVDMLNETQPIGKAVTFITQYISDNLSTAFPIPSNWPTTKNRKYHQAINVLNETLQRIIYSHQTNNEEPSDILQILLNNPELSKEDARGESLNLLTAAQESPTSALAWIWWLLSQHPEINQRVQAEVDEVLGDRRLQFDDLSKTPYIVQVIREALRLYPPAYIIPRKTISQVTLSSGHILPPETRVIVSPYTLHRREDYFKNAEIFNPERFAPEYEQNIAKYTYLPFGAGPHTCIGGYFAMLEMQIAVITMLQKFRLELVPGQTVTPNPLIALRPSTFYMRITRR